MLAAASSGPSSMPASTTTNGCSVSGTGVPGSGIAICDASASAADGRRRCRARELRGVRAARARVVMSLPSGDAERHRVAAAEAERREATLSRLRSFSAYNSVVSTRAPLAPIGWPSAIAPPFTLTRSQSQPSPAPSASACDANASFASIRS